MELVLVLTFSNTLQVGSRDLLYRPAALTALFATAIALLAFLSSFLPIHWDTPRCASNALSLRCILSSYQSVKGAQSHVLGRVGALKPPHHR